MAELPPDFDLKLMPDWLKEPPSKNPYADYEVRDEDRRGRGRAGGGDARGERRGDPRGPHRDAPRGPGGGNRNERGDARGRKPGDKRPGPARGAPARPAEGGPRRDGARDSRSPRDERDSRERTPAAPAPPVANVAIEFFPNEHAASSIAREIKSTHRAYSLFDLARMFLAKPERHWLKISTKSVADLLHQAGENGPITFDKAAAERAAFPANRASFYVEETIQRDAPKGNFANVARCRANGQLLGPTNYHGYQPALRKLYEERYSRRMSFADFQREIEVVSDPALVEQWKEQASTTTVYRLLGDKRAEPVSPEAAEAVPDETSLPAETADAAPPVENAMPVESAPVESAPPESAPVESAPAVEAAPPPPEGPAFASLAEVEQHFREHHLPSLIRSATSFQVSGEISRSIIDRGIASAVRQAWEQERGFPGQMMHHLRQQFTRAGLHVFKHRKRMQFVSLVRPSPMEGGSLSPSVAEILRVIQNDARCTRASLASAILGPEESAVDPARKATLASDLRWLIDTGRVIEFSDGHLDLPLAPAKNEPASKPDAPEPSAGEAEPAGEPVAEVQPSPEVQPAAEAQPSAEEPPAIGGET